ncbi:MAG: DUF4411 family protein [Acidimicrobiia bacterium]|nr:DUF4411 family protein [Acidimicrobiia bacterium]MXX46478.1 DUF4411 family protein [Acidimicrobiia bacterium]MXY73926.1 DUF4411 family protein [Acidimicrobiia bacterium]MYB79545.1 DUF4411 family protein [Acidimicrobiia bacterium]MYD40846.1 DUF4411 family protein [Acidimicrobiia bacterium]
MEGRYFLEHTGEDGHSPVKTPTLPAVGLAARYVLDANAFIASWRDHYPIDLFPGVWACLERFAKEERLLSVDKVRREVNGPPELVSWLREKWRAAFASTRDSQVVGVFSEMQDWVHSNELFLPAAKHNFAEAADGWLAAYAKVHSLVLVTNEAYDQEARRRVPLPNLCRQFDVEYRNTIGMLRGLGVAFELRVL